MCLAASALTSWHHVHPKLLLIFSLQVEGLGVDELPAERAQVRSLVLEGDVGDVDGSVLQVFGLLAAAPFQAVGETLVHDDASSVTVSVQLGHGDTSPQVSASQDATCF